LRNVISQEGPDLEEDITNDPAIIALLRDPDIARQFYASMCNITWKKLRDMPEDERIVETLKGNEYHTWLCSWRAAGSIIAKLRNLNYEAGEDYMNYYCSGGEGFASPIVVENFKRLGWTPDEFN
jgi:hypothetical protein